MSYVKVIRGLYRNKPISNVVFKTSEKEGYVERSSGLNILFVDATDTDGYPNSVALSIKYKSESDVVFSSSPFPEEKDEEVLDVEDTSISSEKSDEELLESISEAFEYMEMFIDGAISGSVRSVIISGGPGVGKSYTVKNNLDVTLGMLDTMREGVDGSKKSFTIEKGVISAPVLFTKLFDFSDEGNVLVLDDCDSIFWDLDSLNILKSALDTSARRFISYNKDSRLLREKGVPNKFEFKGTVIFITNIDFESFIDRKPNGQLTPHLSALMSRTHYLDIGLRTARERLLQIKHVQNVSNFLGKAGCSSDDVAEIIQFMDENKVKLREISLRMAVSLAEKMAISREKWKKMAKRMEFKRQYR